jgi:hypothetical protein
MTFAAFWTLTVLARGIVGLPVDLDEAPREGFRDLGSCEAFVQERSPDMLEIVAEHFMGMTVSLVGQCQEIL